MGFYFLGCCCACRADLAIVSSLLSFFADCGCGDVHSLVVSFCHVWMMRFKSVSHSVLFCSVLFCSVLFGALVDLAWLGLIAYGVCSPFLSTMGRGNHVYVLVD